MAKITKKILPYFLWVITTGFSIYLFFIIRETFLAGMYALNWNHYTINVIDKFAVLILGIIIIVFFLLAQHLYLQKNIHFFWLISSLQLFIFAVCQLVRIHLVTKLLTLDYLLLGGIIIISIIMLICFLHLRKSPVNKSMIN